MHGGVANVGSVVRQGPHVLRPSNPHTPTIHAFLRHLRSAGFEAASFPIGVDPDGRERLEYIEGDVAYPPYPAWAQTDLALASAAALVRRLHDASAGFVPPPDATWSREMADPEGGPVICHNDVCPENVVYRNQIAVGLLDFDFAAPGRRLYDLAQFARMNVPMDSDDDAVLLGRTPPFDPFRRLRIVADAYGLPSGRVSSSTSSEKGSAAVASSCNAASTKATRRSSRWSPPPAEWPSSIAVGPGSRPTAIVSPTRSAVRRAPVA